MDRTPNALISETSPYLLQHAYNPVNWVPWDEKYLQLAKEQDKLVLVSIGYSACHWCHVMEHESFEDAEVAELMNRHLICIKVDREERPDVDQIYMTAVQLMSGRGGWPLNCFLLPDGKPVYGGSYFPKRQWMSILVQLAEGYKKDKTGFEDYAYRLTEAIRSYDLIDIPDEKSHFDRELPRQTIANWKKIFDITEGGPNRAPKFPLPNNYLFLLKYLFYEEDEIVSHHVQLTLDKMAFGGIYDQIGGGFCRYSVDGIWKLPHFEKMLYDNAQLVSLYSEAYKKWKKPLYRDVVYDTLNFIRRELCAEKGNFYSALDADSEGEEGKYYVWKKEELQHLAGNDFSFLAEVYSIDERGYWEHDNFILLRSQDEDAVAKKLNLTNDEFHSKLNSLKSLLLNEREKRIHPGLDDKTLLSWNALMATGFIDAYDTFGEQSFLDDAIANVKFLTVNMSDESGKLFHSYKNGRATVNGFLEDYAFFIHCLIRLYQVTFEKKFLDQARLYTGFVFNHFHSGDGEQFYFTSDDDPSLIARPREKQDNVIPASNSQMAINLFFLGNYFEIDAWINQSQRMLHSMKKMLPEYGAGYSNWLQLWLYYANPLTEIVITGENTLHKRKELTEPLLNPGVILAGSVKEENLSLLKGRVQENQTLIYICSDRNCRLPVTDTASALEIMASLNKE